GQGPNRPRPGDHDERLSAQPGRGRAGVRRPGERRPRQRARAGGAVRLARLDRRAGVRLAAEVRGADPAGPGRAAGRGRLKNAALLDNLHRMSQGPRAVARGVASRMPVIAVTRERRAGETRVAVTPETAKKLTGSGFSIVVERGAGEAASYADAEYEAAGASLAAGPAEAISDADILLKVRAPVDEEVAALKPGALVVGP